MAKNETKNETARWNAVTGFYSGQYMRVGLSTIEERMNWLAMRQTAERKRFRKRDAEQSREFDLARKDVLRAITIGNLFTSGYTRNTCIVSDAVQSSIKMGRFGFS